MKVCSSNQNRCTPGAPRCDAVDVGSASRAPVEVPSGRVHRPAGGFRYPRHVTSTTTRLARRTGVVLTAAALSLLAAAPAHAEVPEGWSDAPDIGLLQMFTVIVAVPAVLFVVITFLVCLPALAKGEKLLPSTSPAPDQWFGGPGRPAGELETTPREVGSTGGASGSW